MPPTLDPQVVTALTGLELLAAVLLVWRGPLAPPSWLLSLQGAALAGLVALIGITRQAPEVLGIAVLVLVLKAIVLPRAVSEPAAAAPSTDRPRRRTDPTRSLLAVAGLAVVAYLVSRPLTAMVRDAGGRALPAGIALILIGMLLLATGTRARMQLVGFLVLDNGIATVAFLATGGVPLVVELGVSLDVLLVVLVLQVLGSRMDSAFGGRDLDLMRELHD